MKLEELENAMDETVTHVWFLWGRIAGLGECFVDEDMAIEHAEDAYEVSTWSSLGGPYDRQLYECRYWESGWSIWFEGRPWHKPSPVPVRSAWGFDSPEKAIAAFCALDSEVIAAFNAAREVASSGKTQCVHAHTLRFHDDSVFCKDCDSVVVVETANHWEYPTPGDWRRTLEGK